MAKKELGRIIRTEGDWSWAEIGEAEHKAKGQELGDTIKERIQVKAEKLEEARKWRQKLASLDEKIELLGEEVRIQGKRIPAQKTFED